MALFGLLGEHLSHSWSPQIHKALAGYDYDLFSIPPEMLGEFLQTTPCRGLNVTIPYKKAVIPYCVELSPAAKRLGSVNTMVKRENGWYGDNTDYAGFCALAEPFAVQGAYALVLGSGGAGVMAAQALRDLGAGQVDIVSRQGEINYVNLNREADLIVNATPVGMYPKNGVAPIDLREFPNCKGVIDLIYNPRRTKLILDAEALGIPAVSGLKMLVVQAQKAAEQFSQQKIKDALAQKVLRSLQLQMENIILIGMPGCGKSTVGRLLAKALNKDFLDADQVLEAQYGPIPAIFEAKGEDGFRHLETKVLDELGKRSGCVIATGGGAVTREENYPLVRQNGTIVRICRPLDRLPTKGRPISQSTKLETLAQQREPFYRAWAEYTIDNTGTPEAAVQAILEAIT